VKSVDELTSIRAEMELLAFFDPLTSLHNRRLFLDRLEQAVRNSRRTRQRLAVLYMDLDGFKQVNDTLGHDVGDSLLCSVGDRILGCVRNEDTVARIGGDEFAVLMTDIIGIDGPKVVAEKISR
jgi:diguanylate cyclase (GGDEF)-like protein